MKANTVLDFKSLFETAPGLSLVVLPDYSIAAISDDYLKATMTVREELLGRNLLEIFPDTADEKAAPGKASLQTSLQYVLQYKQPHAMAVQKYDIRRPGGVFEEWYWSSLNTPVMNATNEIVYIIHHVTDVTKQHSAEDKLKKSKQDFQFLENKVKDYAIITINLDGYMVSANSGAAFIYGYKGEEITDRAMDIFYTTGQLDNEIPKINLLKALEHEYFETEDWQLRKDKTTFWAAIIYTALRNDKGIVYGYSKITRDITERKKAWDQVALLSQQINQSNDAIYTLDANLKISSWNKGAENLYAFTEEEAMGKNSTELLQTDITERAVSTALEKLISEDHWAGELTRITKSGKTIFVNASISTIRDNNGIINGYVAVSFDITNQKQLGEEVNHLARIVEQSSEAIFSIDRNYKIISWNGGAKKLFGLGKEDTIGKPIAAIPALNLPITEIAAIEKTITEYGIWKAEMNYYHTDGTAFFGSLLSGLIQNEKGEITSFIFFIKDISLRKRIEEQLVKSNEELEEKVKLRTKQIYKNENRFRALIENNNDMIALMNEEYKIFYRSPSASRITGWSDEEVIGKEGTKNIHPDDLDYGRKIVQELMDKPGKSINTVFRNQHKDGHYLWVEGTVSNLLRDENIQAIVLNFRDVTERIAIEEKLALRENHYRSIIENMSDAIVLNDEHSNILYQSPSVTKILGYSQKEREGKNVLDYLHPDDVEKFKGLNADLNKLPNVPLPFQYRFLHKNNHYIWLEGVVTNLLQNPAVKAFVANYRDITGRKEGDQKIIDLNTQLEERVKSRTEQLKRSNEELEAFSYSVSHDLRTPLRAISGYTTILEEDYTRQLDDEAKRITSVIKDSAVKMGNLIDGLLAFSRMGRYEIKKVIIDQQQLVQEIIADPAIKQTGEKSIRWVLGPLPSIKAEIYTIKQVWINLISNAVKYSANTAEPVIEIGSFTKDGQVIFFVKDNGVGFDEQYKDKLFKVFQRLHSSNEFEGTGIGLAIVEKIITKYGGKVWVEAALNKGACFFFSVPDER